MKNWNYIEGAKVGNAFSHGDEVLVNSPDWKGMAVVLSQTGSKVRIYSSDGEVVVEEKYVRKVGNQKVGNANTHLTASNSGELWLNFDGTGEMYDPIELGCYDFSGKSEALSVARELEQLKRKAEQKVKDADKFINAIKQWAAGLK